MTHSNRSRIRARRGSALLICTIAAVVISFVVLALARTTQISHLHRKSTRDVAIGHATAEGLFHRAKATAGSGTVQDRDAMIPRATAEVVDSGTNRTIQVVLYNGGVPAMSRTIPSSPSPPTSAPSPRSPMRSLTRPTAAR